MPEDDSLPNIELSPEDVLMEYINAFVEFPFGNSQEDARDATLADAYLSAELEIDVLNYSDPITGD